MEKDVRHFNRWSRTYEDSPAQKFFAQVHDRMLALVTAEAPGFAPATIADIGCGTGRLLRLLRERWPAARTEGVDAAPGMVETARELAPEGSFYQGTAEAIPLPDSSVDLVCSSISMHHWDDAALGMREVFRVLRPAGLFCLADLALPAWLAWLFRSRAKSRRKIGELLRNAGFRIRRQTAMLAGWVLISLAERP